jgi:hypothetical protein
MSPSVFPVPVTTWRVAVVPKPLLRSTKTVKRQFFGTHGTVWSVIAPNLLTH